MARSEGPGPEGSILFVDMGGGAWGKMTRAPHLSRPEWDATRPTLTTVDSSES